MSDEGTSRRIVTIKIGDTLIECSKDDLIQRSRYFAAMFSGRFREDSQDVVELKVIPEIITPVLKQLLSGNVLEIQNITQPLLLLHAAVIYQFDREIEDCQQMIFKDLFSYLPAAIEVATELDLVQLKKKAILVFLVHFEQLRSSSSFAAIDDVELIYEILNHDNLVAYSEKNVYCAMSFWLSHNASEHNTFQRLIQAIRFAKLDTQDIYEINDELTSRQDFGCQDFLIVMASVASREETFICMNCVDDKTGEPCTCRITGEMKTVVLEVWRKERISPFVPCLVAVERNEKSSLYRYEPHNGRFACLWDCPPHQIAIRKKKSLIGYRLATVGVFIYLFGGEWGLGRGSFNTEVWCFSTLSESWTRAGNVTPRRHFFVCSNAESVFLIGGTGKHRITREDIEVFSIATGKSELFCDNVGRIDSACISGNYLYIAQSYKVLRIDTRTRDRLFLRSLRVLGSRFMHAEKNWLFFYYDDYLMKCEIRDAECGPSEAVCPLCTEDVESHELVTNHQFYCFYMVRGSKVMCKCVHLTDNPNNPIIAVNQVLDVSFTSSQTVCLVPFL